MGPCYVLGTVVFSIRDLIIILLKILQSMLLFSLDRGRNRVSDKLSALSKITQLLRSRARVRPQVCQPLGFPSSHT